MLYELRFWRAVGSWAIFGFVSFSVEGVLFTQPGHDFPFLGSSYRQAFEFLALASIFMIIQAFSVCLLLWKSRLQNRFQLALYGAAVGFLLPCLMFFLLFPLASVAQHVYFQAGYWLEVLGYTLLGASPILLGGGLLGGVIAGLWRWRSPGRELT
jgi:hypothetical protein